jgi:hypothetical protein
MLTHTYTKTYVRLHAWASTIPADHGDMPRPGDPCAVPRCTGYLRDNETVYAVIESGGPDAPEPVPCRYGPYTTAECGHAEQWVCWRHVRPDDGPITVPPHRE